MIINTQQVIDHFSRVHKKIFIIKTESHSFWHSMANKILYRDENSNFILTPLPALQLLDNFDDFVEQESVHQEQDKLLTFKNIPKHLIAK